MQSCEQIVGDTSGFRGRQIVTNRATVTGLRIGTTRKAIAVSGSAGEYADARQRVVRKPEDRTEGWVD